MFQLYIKKIGLIVFILIATISFAQATEVKDLFIEGQDYTRLPDDMRKNPDIAQLLMDHSNQVQVLFFFSYGCHACEVFHTPFENWAAGQKSNKKLAIYRFPVQFHPQWAPLAKLFYTMQTLDKKGKMNNIIFDAIHKKNIKLWEEPVMTDFLVKNGFDSKQVTETFNSFNVNRLAKKADDISKAYKIMETPEIVVNGPVSSYKLELAKVQGSNDRFFKLLDYIVKRETKLLNG